MSELRVESLHIYPVKSCAGLDLQSASIAETGLRHDRYFMVIDADNNHVSQREKPELALVKPLSLGETQGSVCLDLSSPRQRVIDLVHTPSDNRRDKHIVSFVHGKPVMAMLVDPDVDRWFSNYLGEAVRFVAIDRNQPRLIKDRYRQAEASNQVGFADGYSLELTSVASLKALNEAIKNQTGGEEVPMNRFRPNIVVSGEVEAYEEDYWRRLQIGKMFASVVRPVARCMIPYIDQKTGQLSDAKTVGKALALTRRGFDTTKPDDDGKKVYFGQYLNHVYHEGQRLHVGDEVTILARANESNFKPRPKAV